MKFMRRKKYFGLIYTKRQSALVSYFGFTIILVIIYVLLTIFNWVIQPVSLVNF